MITALKLHLHILEIYESLGYFHFGAAFPEGMI